MTRDEAAKLFPKLSPLAIRKLWRQLKRTDEEALGFGESIFVWLAALLSSSSPISPEAVDLLLNNYVDDLVKFGCEFQPDKETVIMQLAILDRSYAVLSGRDGFLCLASGDHRPTLNEAPVEVITYNIGALALQAKRKLDSLQRRKESADVQRKSALERS
jgi:hypothetical protein